MSFQEQQQALFDLLFDTELRKDFIANRLDALSDYVLTQDELNDFLTIRLDALAFDADLRNNLLLEQVCRALPLSFSLTSSLDHGLELLQSLVDKATMRSIPEQRVLTFSNRLREKISQRHFDTAEEKNALLAIIDAELGIAWSAASLKMEIIAGTITDNNKPANEDTPLPDNWLNQSVKLANYVCASIIPLPYQTLKNQLCPKTTDLWRTLTESTVNTFLIRNITQTQNPRLFVTRAFISTFSTCDPDIEHKTVELSEGFASLLQHIDGNNSIAYLLAELKKAGAPDKLCQSIEAGFLQLLQTGMIEIEFKV